MRELREVVSDAGALAGELEKANRLPLDFPTEQLHELLAELQSLPAGTAEGCRQPLEYARARLPAVRRQFIQTEEEVRQPMADEDAPPSLTRGMTIDLRIGALVNSVTTALDEYRALASAHDDDAADTAPSIKIDATSPDAVHAMAVSQKAERAIGEHVNELQRITKPDSVTADNLKRQMHDARGLLSLARIELRMPAFVPRWYRKTIDTVRDYPRILSATANAVRMGVDVTRPMADAWHGFERGFSQLVFDAIEDAATELLEVARKWEKERARRKDKHGTAAGAPPGDFSFGVARGMILSGTSPKPSWRPWITELDFSGEDLDDLAPLARLTALRHLILDTTMVSNLLPLARLTAMEVLDLEGTLVSDLSPLARLTGLHFLDLGGTQVTDLSPLARLAALRKLIIDDTEVTDLSPLARLTALESLDLAGTHVSDLLPLARLTALKYLNLHGTQVSDLSPLARLTAPQQLRLDGTLVSDLSPLAHLTALEYLDLDGTQVRDVSPLARLTALRSLLLQATQVTDLSPLFHISDLKIIGVRES